MRLRNCQILLRLTEKEKRQLQGQADLCGLKMNPFLRNLIAEKEMKARPQEKWAALVRQVSGVANNINQIAKKVNTEDAVTMGQLRLLEDMLSQIWDRLMDD